jgi:diguanylate cyclase (GGDEF)-like protein
MNEFAFKPHPVTLGFSDKEVESAYESSVLPRMRWHGRVATVVGLLVYFIFGVLDAYYVPEHLRAVVWEIRGLAALGGLVLLALSWHRSYTAQVCNLSLVSIGGVGSLSLLLIFWICPPYALATYYAGLLLMTFFTYNFIGTRFVYALAANLVLAATYNVLFGWLHPVPMEQLLSHNLHLFSANVLGGTAAYFAEYQRRRLYLAEHVLNLDRQQLRHHALHDALTELPNRVLLIDRIEQAITQSRRTGQGGVVLFVDLDGFKSVNDIHGHEAGDKVLREVAQRLRDCLRESDTLSRIGGDEFVLLSLGVCSEEQLAALSDKLLQVLEQPYAVRTQRKDQHALVRISASMGACFFPHEDCEAHELIRRSDEAMYRAKRDGGAFSVWSRAA